MCDYCCKGAPLLIPVRIEREGGRQVIDVDEFAYETRMRYFTASEISGRLCSVPIIPLPRRLELQRAICYDAGKSVFGSQKAIRRGR